MKTAFVAAVAAMILAGCGGGMSAFEQLRIMSEVQAKRYAESGGAFLANGGTKDDLISKGEKAVAYSLKDPESAKFRNVRVSPYMGGYVVCGEVNAKNSYGGYTGFTRFFGDADAGTLEDSDARYPQTQFSKNYGLNAACPA